MTTKTICDGCGVEIAKPIPYRIRYKRLTNYQTKAGEVKYREIFATLDFDSAKCLMTHITSNKEVFELPVVEVDSPAELDGGEKIPEETKKEVIQPVKGEYRCTECGKVFDEDRKLRIHSKIKHQQMDEEEVQPQIA